MTITVVLKLGDQTIGEAKVHADADSTVVLQADPMLVAAAVTRPVADEVMERLRERWRK